MNMYMPLTYRRRVNGSKEATGFLSVIILLSLQSVSLTVLVRYILHNNTCYKMKYDECRTPPPISETGKHSLQCTKFIDLLV